MHRVPVIKLNGQFVYLKVGNSLFLTKHDFLTRPPDVNISQTQALERNRLDLPKGFSLGSRAYR